MKDRYDSVEFGTVKYMATSGGISCADADARNAYYNLTGFPTCWFNGGSAVVGASADMADGSSYDPIIQAMLDDATPVMLSITDYEIVSVGQSHVDVTVELSGDIGSANRQNNSAGSPCRARGVVATTALRGRDHEAEAAHHEGNRQVDRGLVQDGRYAAGTKHGLPRTDAAKGSGQPVALAALQEHDNSEQERNEKMESQKRVIHQRIPDWRVRLRRCEEREAKLATPRPGVKSTDPPPPRKC